MSYKIQTNTVKIHKPTLNESEKRKREEEVIKALERFGKAIENEKSK